MARRIGCAAGVLLLVVAGVVAALVWLVLSATGAVNSGLFTRAVSAAALLLGVLAVLAGVRVIRRLATPAGSLVEAAGRIEAGDYSARAPERGPRELRSLARALNAMSSRLEADEVRRRSLLADVAHEFRTPLTVIRGQAEGIVDGVYAPGAQQMAPILAATATLEVLVEDLRTLALAEAGTLRLNREGVDAGLLVNETLDALRPAAAEAGVSLAAHTASEVRLIDGDPARLRGVVGNLVSNALRHTPRGGTVRVATSDSAAGVRITVADDGEGIAPDLLPRVFDRFVKGPDSRGSGLGLAIVRDVVEAHGGTVSAESAPGAGTAVHLTLPAVVGPPA